MRYDDLIGQLATYGYVLSISFSYLSIVLYQKLLVVSDKILQESLINCTISNFARGDEVALRKLVEDGQGEVRSFNLLVKVTSQSWSRSQYEV